MKILITGATSTHINDPKRAVTTKFMSIPELVTSVYRELGFSVEHRIVKKGEPLEQFDKVICFLYPLDKHARHPEGAQYVLQNRKDAIIAVDDWSCSEVQHTWHPLVGSLSDRNWIIPLFPWGDASLLGIKGTLHTYDPSNYCETLEVENWEQRVRAWVHGAFHKNSHEFVMREAGWKTLSFGCRELGQDKVLESTLVKLHGVVAGSIQAPYKHVGAGWWRVRTLHAIRNKTVIGCHPKEFCGLDISLELPISRIETLDDDNLRQLADMQAEVITKELWSRGKVLEFFLEILNL